MQLSLDKTKQSAYKMIETLREITTLVPLFQAQIGEIAPLVVW